MIGASKILRDVSCRNTSDNLTSGERLRRSDGMVKTIAHEVNNPRRLRTCSVCRSVRPRTTKDAVSAAAEDELDAGRISPAVTLDTIARTPRRSSGPYQ